MNDYLFLMHSDQERSSFFDWEGYISRLRESGNFDGGSAIGNGECVKKSGHVPTISGHLSGYIRVQAKNLDHAKSLLEGNPVFEAGGTVEIRELPRG